MDPEIDYSVFLEFFSHRIMEIAIPVIITLLGDAILTRFLEQTHETVDLDRSFYRTMNPTSTDISFTWSIILAFILVGMIILVTAILLLCYYYGCVKAIMVWMVIAVSLLLSLYIYLAFSTVPELLNTPFDWIAVVLFFLNLVIVGNLSIFWRAPSIVTHAFLILISILIAIIFLNLPDWTVWILLVILIIYDCCVVLCPHGLLNVIIKKSEERGDAIPALVYASAAWFSQINHNQEECENENDENEFNDDVELNDENEFNDDVELNDENELDGDGRGSDDESDHQHHYRRPRRRDDDREIQDHNQNDRNQRRNKRNKQSDLNQNLLPNKNDDDSDGCLATVNTVVIDELSSSSSEKDKKRRKKKKKNSEKLTEKELKEQEIAEKKRRRFQSDDEEGIKLGLGDFCFYGVLVTRAARIGWDITILCIFAVILGLSLTLIILAITQRALPALPFSLALGIIFYIIGIYTFRPFYQTITDLKIAI